MRRSAVVLSLLVTACPSKLPAPTPPTPVAGEVSAPPAEAKPTVDDCELLRAYVADAPQGFATLRGESDGAEPPEFYQVTREPNGSTGCQIEVDDPPPWLQCQLYHQYERLEDAVAISTVQAAYRAIGERVVACLPPDEWTSKPITNGTSFVRVDGKPPSIDVEMDVIQNEGSMFYDVNLSVMMDH